MIYLRGVSHDMHINHAVTSYFTPIGLNGQTRANKFIYSQRIFVHHRSVFDTMHTEYLNQNATI